jgi:ADP-ribose pyrophosphatase
MTETELLFNGRWLNVRRRGGWEFVERANPKGAVIIVALTDADELVFVEQFRPPVDAVTIEMPAGLIGDIEGTEHEDAITSAHRELIEETGYEAARIDYVTGGPVSSGLSTEIAHFVRATGLKRVGEGGGDETENIVVHHVPLKDAAAWLVAKAAAGHPLDPKLWAGLYFAERNADGSAWR